MKIVTWNCHGESAQKVSAIAEEYSPDFLVMPESAQTPPQVDLFSVGDENGHRWTRAFREGEPEFASNLEDRFGLVSAYHQHSGESFGQETHPTYWHQYKEDLSFHIDYVFVPKTWTVVNVEVGTFANWTAKDRAARSDHAPLIVDLNW